MTGLLTELLLRSSLTAAATALILSAFRIKAAATRHAAWATVVVTMLVLPASLASGVRMTLPVLAPASHTEAQTAMPETIVATDVTTQQNAAAAPAAPSARQASTVPARSADWRLYLLATYLGGAFVLCLRLAIGTIQANRLRRTATIHDGRLTSDRCATPITVGWFAPALILPRGWDRWSSAQLAVVLAHEHEHARRHDPLVQWLALLNRAVFWFHPLAWWLERRLATLSEEACDVAVIAAGHSPQDYSEYLLDMARAVSHQQGRVRLIGMAMPGAGLPNRLKLIFQGLPIGRPSRARLICTITFCAASSVMFAAGTLAERGPIQLTPANVQAPLPALTLGPQAATPPARVVASSPSAPKDAITQNPTRPAVPALQIKFEAVSIRPCEPGTPSSGARGGGGMRNAITPGYATWGCVSLAELIDQAYGGGPFPKNALLNTIRVPPGMRLDAPKRIRGGPDWVEKERFAIEIRLSGDATNLTGSARHDLVLTAMAPALQAMLQDRFQLKLRKATEEQPMYALAIAPGGLKLTAADLNKCYQVTPEERAAAGRMGPPPPAGFEDSLPCGEGGSRIRSAGTTPGNVSLQFTHVSMNDFAKWLSENVDRYVLDRTGVDGLFNFKLEYAPDDTTLGDNEHAALMSGIRRQARPDLPPQEHVKGDGPTIFKALELLGLTVQKTKGPAEYLLIDSAQRPKPNDPAAAELAVDEPALSRATGASRQR